VKSRIIYFLICLLCLSGCGVYSFKGQGIGGIKTIAVEPFDNQTAEFGIREQITDAILTKLLGDRTLSIANSQTADAILRGRVIQIDDRPLSYHENETVTEYQVTLTVEVMLFKPGQSDPILQMRLTGEGNYPYQTGSPDERKQGLDKAVEQLVQDLMNRLTSDW
jgi:outer membrane lipopolysaccharide assembly protein LptE/RlpB